MMIFILLVDHIKIDFSVFLRSKRINSTRLQMIWGAWPLQTWSKHAQLSYFIQIILIVWHGWIVALATDSIWIGSKASHLTVNVPNAPRVY